MDRRKIIIDTDPGIDDAVAIAIALFDENLDVKLITTVAGNVDVDKTTDNALKLVEFFGKDIPVAKGASKPLLEEFTDASDIHGNSGLDGYEYKTPVKQILKEDAVSAMRKVIMESDTPITLVPIAPLTNIALLLSTYEDVKDNIKEIVLMGGSLTRGNKTPMGEFNIATDPTAADIVFRSKIPIVMCCLDVGLKALVNYEDSESIRKMNKTGEMIYSLFKHYRAGSLIKGLKMFDCCAMAYLADPEMFKTQECYVAVETSSALTKGCTVADLNNFWGMEPNARVCLDIDPERFKRWFLSALNRCI